MQVSSSSVLSRELLSGFQLRAPKVIATDNPVPRFAQQHCKGTANRSTKLFWLGEEEKRTFTRLSQGQVPGMLKIVKEDRD